MDIAPNKTSVIRPRLVMEQTGTLVVATDLRDALIQVDGEPKGFTPAVVTSHPGGRPQHTGVALGVPAHRAEGERWDANKQATLNLELAREAQVSAVSRTTQLVEEAPSSVSIITGQELRAMGYPTIAEAVRGVRGVYLTDYCSYVTLGFRGFSRPGDYGNKILILDDGHPFNDKHPCTSPSRASRAAPTSKTCSASRWCAAPARRSTAPARCSAWSTW